MITHVRVNLRLKNTEELKTGADTLSNTEAGEDEQNYKNVVLMPAANTMYETSVSAQASG